MSKVKLLLDLVDELRSLTDTLDEVAAVLSGNDIRDAPHERVNPETGEITTLNLDTLRREAAAKSDKASVKTLLTSFSASKISDLPENDYPAFWDALAKFK